MQYIDFKVQHQTITRTDKYEVVGNSQNYLHARFQFCKEWEDITVTAVFSTNSGKHYSAVIEDGECIVPWEVLTGAEFWVGVFGGDRMTTSTARVAVKPGVKTKASPGLDPTPTAYETLVASAAASAEVAENARKAAADSAAVSESAAERADSAKGLVLEALNNVPAGSTVVVNNLTAGGTSAALSAEMGKELGRRPNPNLLHNWYFLNAVNIRGQKKYTGEGHTVDRWYNGHKTAMFTVTENGLLYSNTTGKYNAVALQQHIENYALYAGRTVTLSVLVREVAGTVRFALKYDSGNNIFVEFSEPGLHSVTGIIGDTPDQLRVYFASMTSGALAMIEAVKLELGNTQTLAHWDGSKYVLNETPDKAQETVRCCMSRADLSDMCANNYSAVIAEPEFRLMSQKKYAEEMVAVARSYLEQDAAHFAETGERYFSYNSLYTCLSNEFGSAEAESLNNIDCSVFIGMVLRGIPFSKSPYALPFSDRKDWDRNSVKANTEDFCWSVNPFEWETSRKKDDTPDEYNYLYRVRFAGQLAEWLTALGSSYVFAKDFSNVEPGDIIFFTAFEDGEYKYPDRYKHISHVALCATKEVVADGEDGFDGYPFKHQIYDSTTTGDEDARTFFYEDDGAGGIKSTRYLEENATRVVAICRPVFLARESGVVTSVRDGGTGARNAAEAVHNIGAAVRPNLLHNWYFLNAVNQRGKAVYAGEAGIGTIDGWKLNSQNASVSLNDRGIVFTNSKSNGVSWSQKLEQHKPFIGKTLTASVIVTEVSGTIGFALRAKGSGDETVEVRFSDPGLYSVTRTMPDDTDTVMPFFICRTGGATATISAVKLELGDSQTLAYKDADGNWVLNEIPDFGVELTKCQRYFQLFSSEDKRPTALVDYRPTMAAEPTTGTIEIDGTTYYYAEVNV